MSNDSPILNVLIPEYKIDQKPDYSKVGKAIDKVIIDNFLGKDIAVRCLSIRDHIDISVDQLIEKIKELGTDKYDPERQMSVAHEFYTEKGVEIFATSVKVNQNMTFMNEIIKDFYEGALGDRGCSLKVDLIVVYDVSQLELIPIQYDDGIGEEAFKFKYPDKRPDAVLGFLKLTS